MSEIQVRFFHTNPLAAENPLSEGSTQPLGPPFPGTSSVPVSEHDSPAYVDTWADPQLVKKLKSINMSPKFSGQLELQPPKLAWTRWVNQLRYVMRSRGLTTTWQQCVGFGEALAGPPLDLFLAEVHGAAIMPTFDEFLSRLSSQCLPRTNLQHWVIKALENAKLQSDESVQQYVLRLCELFRLSSSPKSIEDQHPAFLKGLPPSL